MMTTCMQCGRSTKYRDQLCRDCRGHGEQINDTADLDRDEGWPYPETDDLPPEISEEEPA
jgi:hypothetical protein